MIENRRKPASVSYWHRQRGDNAFSFRSMLVSAAVSATR